MVFLDSALAYIKAERGMSQVGLPFCSVSLRT